VLTRELVSLLLSILFQVELLDEAASVTAWRARLFGGPSI
jgi:hypothetical protein